MAQVTEHRSFESPDECVLSRHSWSGIGERGSVSARVRRRRDDAESHHGAGTHASTIHRAGLARAGRRRCGEKLTTEGCRFRTLSGDATGRAWYLEVAQWREGSVVQRPGWQHAGPHTVLSMTLISAAGTHDAAACSAAMLLFAVRTFSTKGAELACGTPSGGLGFLSYGVSPQHEKFLS
jgi:hypothetical protein